MTRTVNFRTYELYLIWSKFVYWEEESGVETKEMETWAKALLGEAELASFGESM